MTGSLSFERWAPVLISAAVFAAALKAGFALPPEGKKEILSAAISVGAIFAGFLGTAKAILMALPSTGLPARLRSSGYMDDLARYMAEALAGSLLLCVVSIAGLFPLEVAAPCLFGGIWASVSAYSVVSFWRVSRIMLSILKLDPDKL